MSPVEVPDSLFISLRQQFSEAQIVELTAAIAWENYHARFNHAWALKCKDFQKEHFALCQKGEQKINRIYAMFAFDKRTCSFVVWRFI